MSNNNSSANIIINSMIHHSKLSLKGNRKTFRLQERSWFWGGWVWGLLAEGHTSVCRQYLDVLSSLGGDFNLPWGLRGSAQHRPGSTMRLKSLCHPKVWVALPFFFLIQRWGYASYPGPLIFIHADQSTWTGRLTSWDSNHSRLPIPPTGWC